MEPQGDGAVIMTNGFAGEALIQEVLRSIEDAYEWDGNDPPVRAYAPKAHELEACIGYYLSGSDDPLSITSNGTHLVLARPYQPRQELVNVGPNDFVDREDGAHFGFDAAGVTRTLAKEGQRYARANESSAPLSLLANNRAAAREQYRKLFSEAPKDPLLAESRFLSLGEGSMLRNLSLGDAASLFEVATMPYSDSAAAHALLAAAYWRVGKRAEAKTEYLLAQKQRANAAPTDELARTILADRLARLAQQGIEK